jgi:inner membrane protein
MEKPSFLERANNWVRNSVTLRLVTMGILILLLLIPVNMVESLIREREYRKEDAVKEVSGKWGNEQIVAGPVLTVPYLEYNKQYNNDTKEYILVPTRRYAHFLPEALNVDGEISPEIRYRGIYKVVVYKAALKITGAFNRPNFAEWKVSDNDVLWGESFVSLGLTDLRGIQQNVDLGWNNQTYSFNPGVETNEVITTGISAMLPIDTSKVSNTYSLNLNFNGSSLLEFLPLGKTTTVNITSPWATPSFDGAFLPDERDVTEKGFTAMWDVLHLNRPYPQSFRGAATGLDGSAFGVKLILPVDEYQKSMRSAKYAVMFIVLTFIIIFFVQIMYKVRVHPIQYIIVGLALCVFYTLLIGLSEYIPFAYSYLISSVGIIALITLYSQTIFHVKRITALIGLLLTVLYLFIFTIVQMEDFALLMGSIGLFIVLATIMYLSRKINWYNIEK